MIRHKIYNYDINSLTYFLLNHRVLCDGSFTKSLILPDCHSITLIVCVSSS